MSYAITPFERALADDPEFREAFLQVERARRSQIVADALAADDAEALRLTGAAPSSCDATSKSAARVTAPELEFDLADRLDRVAIGSANLALVDRRLNSC
jgi:hypothetical protein